MKYFCTVIAAAALLSAAGSSVWAQAPATNVPNSSAAGAMAGCPPSANGNVTTNQGTPAAQAPQGAMNSQGAPAGKANAGQTTTSTTAAIATLKNNGITCPPQPNTIQNGGTAQPNQ